MGGKYAYAVDGDGGLIGGGLGTIQDEADSNQDSDFSGDDDGGPGGILKEKEKNEN